MLNHHDDDVVEVATHAVCIASQGSIEDVDALLEIDILRYLVKLLISSKPSEVVENALKTINNISSSGEAQVLWCNMYYTFLF